MPSKPKRPVLPPATEGGTSRVYPFSEGEYNKVVAALKNNKAAGRDDTLVEQLNHLGPEAHKWLLTMLINICFMENKIPTVWRQSKIIAILKPGKDSSIPKNYRPISLLCYTYKLYERMILNRIAPAIEQHLLKEQAGFRSGKSCISHLLSLTQHIDDGYEEGIIHQKDTACSWLVRHSRGDCSGEHCKLYPPTPPLRRPGRPVFWGSRPCVPAAWLAERLLLAGDIESNPGPKPTLKTPTHTRTQPPTLTKYTNTSIQPPRARPPPLPSPPTTQNTHTCPTPKDPHLHLLSTSPHTHSVHPRPNTTCPSRLSPYFPTTQTSIRPHTCTLSHTQQTKDLQNKTQRDKNSSTQRKRNKEHRGRT